MLGWGCSASASGLLFVCVSLDSSKLLRELLRESDVDLSMTILSSELGVWGLARCGGQPRRRVGQSPFCFFDNILASRRFVPPYDSGFLPFFGAY